MGGTWSEGVPEERAGLYMNFRKKAEESSKVGVRGVALIPLVLNWGAPKQFTKLSHSYDYLELFGYHEKAVEVRSIRESRKECKTVLVYRMNEGVKAKLTLVEPVPADPGPEVIGQVIHAKWGGTRGNDISIHIQADVIETDKFKFLIVVDNDIVHNQTVQTFDQLVDNEWVTFEGSGALTPVAGLKLTGGANGEKPTVLDYNTFFQASEMQVFNTIALPTDEEALIEVFVEFVKRLTSEGKMFQGVISSHTYTSNNEGIINVINGVELEDGYKIDRLQAVCYIAGATAGASISQSNTYLKYAGAVDAYPRLSPRELVASIRRGQMAFMYDGRSVKIEKDINTLVDFRGENELKPEKFKFNRVIRTIHAINNDLQDLFAENYVGKIDNDGDGHAILKSLINTYLERLEELKGITNFDAKNDVIIDTAKSIASEDSVYATIGVQPLNSMEKFYFTVEVR